MAVWSADTSTKNTAEHMRSWLRRFRSLPSVFWNSDEGQYGLCDRLRGLACGLAWADGLHRHLHYGWRPNELCPAEFEALFEPPPRASILAELKNEQGSDVIYLSMAANPLPHQFWHQLLVHGLPTRGFGSEDEFHEAWRRHLRLLRPVAGIRRSINECRDLAGRRPLIGIHIRRTDVVESVGKPEIHEGNLEDHDRILLAKVRTLAANRRDACFYLAADSQVSFRRWAGMLASECIPFVSHEKEWRPEFRQTKIADAVVDLWMLGVCQEVLGTVNSGFLVIAAAMGAGTQVLPVSPQSSGKGLR